MILGKVIFSMNQLYFSYFFQISKYSIWVWRRMMMLWYFDFHIICFLIENILFKDLIQIYFILYYIWFTFPLFILLPTWRFHHVPNASIVLIYTNIFLNYVTSMRRGGGRLTNSRKKCNVIYKCSLTVKIVYNKK